MNRMFMRVIPFHPLNLNCHFEALLKNFTIKIQTPPMRFGQLYAGPQVNTRNIIINISDL